MALLSIMQKMTAMVLNYLGATGPAQSQLATRIASMASDQTAQLSDEQLDERRKLGEYGSLQQAHTGGKP